MSRAEQIAAALEKQERDERRIERVEAALKAADQQAHSGDEPEAMASDLMADLLHYVEAKTDPPGEGHDRAATVHDLAWTNYRAEATGVEA